MWLYLLAAIVGLVIFKFIQLNRFWKDRGLPYEPYWLYLYRVLWKIHQRSISENQIETCERYGPVYGSYRGFKPALVTTEVEHVKEVFVKQFDKFNSRSFEFTTGEPLWDNTLLQLPYDQWKAIRTIMGYTLTTTKMRGIILKLEVISDRLLSKFDRLGGKEASLGQYFKPFGIDSVTAIALGVDVNTIDNPGSDFVKYTAEIFRPNLASLLLMTAPKLIKYVPFVHFPPKETVKFLEKMCHHVIEDKRKNLDEVIKNGTADILDHHLIAQRENPLAELTDDMLASQAFLFLLGVDNTVLALELTTYFFTVFPEAQQRAYEEIRSIVGSKTAFDYEDYQKMKYLYASLLESLRLVPVGAFIDRICTTDTVVAGQEINEGMVVEFNMHHMQMNPDYFPEPEKYKPERFLKDQEGPPSELEAYLAFGKGPKNCVGRRLALMNMMVLLSKLVLRFKLEPTVRTPKLPLKIKPGIRGNDITVEPLMLRLTPRTG